MVQGTEIRTRICNSTIAIAAALASLWASSALSQTLEVANSEPVKVKVFTSTRDHAPEIHESRAPKSKFAATPQANLGPGTLALPLRPSVSAPAADFFSISSFFDHNDNLPDQLTDYNCGARTYDTENFNHNGTDYQSIQFPWWTMENERLITTAAADGVIVDRNDGEPDQNCAFVEGAQANYVTLEHDDGSLSIYAHFKTGTVTPRQVGDRVEAGDYLGVIGSSGISTGPHLHMGIQDSARRLIDPYAGACNLTVDDSWWQSPEPYHVKRVVGVATHSESPVWPPCPQVEAPNFKDVFDPSDAIFPSVTVRDFEQTDTIDVQMLAPNGQVIFETTYTQTEIDFAPNITVVWGLQFSQPLPEGTYTVRGTYSGTSLEHEFYVGRGEAPPPAPVPANNQFAGLWYDPGLDGEGYNVVTSDAGTIFYFYGSDSRGNRIWLISDVVPGPLTNGSDVVVNMYESTGGVFATPISSARGLSPWGQLTMRFNGCENGRAVLNGEDGNKTSELVKLVGISGSGCTTGGAFPDASWSGLWFDASKDGEGYNLLVTPVGRILYFYGFKTGGLRLWLISDVFAETLTAGTTVTTTVYEATAGTFANPLNSTEALEVWGTASITVLNCNEIRIVIDGKDGTKTSNTVRLAGIIGLDCTG